MTGGLGVPHVTMETATTRTSHEVAAHHPKRTMVGAIIDVPTGFLPDATHADRITTWTVRVEQMYDPERTVATVPNDDGWGLPESGRRRVPAGFRAVARMVRFGWCPVLVTSSHPTMTRARGLTPRPIRAITDT